MDNKKKEETLTILRSYSHHISSSSALSKEISSALSLEQSKGVVAIPMKIIKKPSQHRENTFDLIPEQIIKKAKEDPQINLPLQMDAKQTKQTPKKESPTKPPKEETTATKLITSKELNKIRQYMDMSSSVKPKQVIPRKQDRYKYSLTEFDYNSKTDWQRSTVNTHSIENPANKNYYKTEGNFAEPLSASMKLTKKCKRIPSPSQDNNNDNNMKEEEDIISLKSSERILELNSLKKYKKKITPNSVVSLSIKRESTASRNSTTIAIDRDRDKESNKMSHKQKRRVKDSYSSGLTSNIECDSMIDINNNTKSNNCYITFRAQSPNKEDKLKENNNQNQHEHEQQNRFPNNTDPSSQTNDLTKSQQIESRVNFNEQLNTQNHDQLVKDDEMNGSPTHHYDNISNETKRNNKSNALEVLNKDMQVKDRPDSINTALCFRASERLNGLSSDVSSQQRLLYELQIDNCTNYGWINKDNKISQSTHSIRSDNANSISNMNELKGYLQPLELINSIAFSIVCKDISKDKEKEKDKRTQDTITPDTYREDQFSLNYNVNDNHQHLNEFSHYNDHHQKMQNQSEGFTFPYPHPLVKKENITGSYLYYNHIPRRHELIFDFERNKDKIASNRGSTENLSTYFRNNFTNNTNRNTSSVARLQMEMNTDQSTHSNENMMLIQKEYHFGTKEVNNSSYQLNNQHSQSDKNSLPDVNNNKRYYFNTQSQTTEGDIKIIPQLSYDQLHYNKKPLEQHQDSIGKSPKKKVKSPINLKKKASPFNYYLLSTENRNLNLKLCGHIDFYKKNNNLSCRQCSSQLNNNNNTHKSSSSKDLKNQKKQAEKCDKRKTKVQSKKK